MVGRRNVPFEMVPVFLRDIRSFSGRGSETPHAFSVGEAFNGFECVFPRKIGRESWKFPKQTTGRKTTPKTKKDFMVKLIFAGETGAQT